MKRKKRGSAAPIYAFTAAWIICAVIFPLYELVWLILSFAVSLAAGIATAAVIGRRPAVGGDSSAGKNPSGQTESPAQEMKPQYSPEVQKIMDDGKLAMREMGRLYSTIDNAEVRKKINEIMRISDKIVQDAVQDESDVPQIRKFLDYYLPTTIKLLNAYDRMSDQGIAGDNLTRSMKSIEDMLDTAIEAYKKQLDSLFENQALDIETDISVMNQMLAREGLTGGGGLDDLITKAARSGSGSAGPDNE